MFFNKGTKQAFIFPKKVGTITTRHFLGSIGWQGVYPLHSTATEFIEKYPALNDYTIYAFFRDPVKRYESAILHCKQFPVMRDTLNKLLQDNGINKSAETVSYDELIGIHDALTGQFKVLFYPQTHWLSHPKVIVLDFNNFESELRRITGNFDAPMKRWNTASDFGRSTITPTVEEFVQQQYADDYNLAARNNI
jgi:hypothetical protein